MDKKQKDSLNNLLISEDEIIEGYEKELKQLTHQKLVSSYREISDKIHRATWLFNTLYKIQKRKRENTVSELNAEWREKVNKKYISKKIIRDALYEHHAHLSNLITRLEQLLGEKK